MSGGAIAGLIGIVLLGLMIVNTIYTAGRDQ